MADTDPIMDKICRDQRRMAWRIWPAISAFAVIVGALSAGIGYWIGSMPPDPIIVRFDTLPRVQVHITPEAKP